MPAFQWSGGLAATNTLINAKALATTLIMDSRASERMAEEWVSRYPFCVRLSIRVWVLIFNLDKWRSLKVLEKGGPPLP